MINFAFCFFILYGPVRESDGPKEIPAARLFALLEQQLDCRVQRNDPELDLVPVKFCESSNNARPTIIKLVLQANGIFLHEIVTPEAAVILVASRELKKDSVERPLPFVKVYTPVYLQPEKLLEALKSSKEAEGLEVNIYKRTGRIVLKSFNKDAVQKALQFLGKIDKSRRHAVHYHSFKCVSVKVENANKELLRLISRPVRSRSRIVAYERLNTLLVACGSDDWKKILEILKKLDPKGKIY